MFLIYSSHSYCISRCDCQKFSQANICAHCIAAAFNANELDSLIARYETPNLHRGSVDEKSKDGRKPGYRARQRGEHKRQTAGFAELPAAAAVAAAAGCVDDEAYSLVFVKDTAAYKCYGCKGAIRKNGNDNPPPPPFDIFVTSKTYRHFREKGKNGKAGILHIKTKKENVYYHPQLACIGKTRAEVAGKLVVPEELKFRFTPQHRNVIWNEFGYRM